MSAAVDVEAQTSRWNIKHAFHFATKNTRRSSIHDVRARFVVSMNGFGTWVKDVLVRMGEIADKLQMGFAILIRTTSCVVCEKLINILMSGIAATSVEAQDALGTRFILTGEVGAVLCEIGTDLDVLSKRFPLPAKGSDESAIETNVHYLISYVTSFNLPAPHATNAFSSFGSSDDTRLVDNQAPVVSGELANTNVATLHTMGTVPSEAKSTSVTRSVLMMSHPSAVATSSWIACSTSPPKTGSCGAKRSS